MATLGIRFLTPVHGRDHSAPEFPEWPPHPARVYQALVATACETGRMSGCREALEALAGAPPPALRFQENAGIGRSPEVFVPRNQSSDHKNTVVSRPVALPWDPTVTYHWTGLSAEVRGWLKVLAPEITHVGRASSLVTAELLEAADEPNWVPDPTGELLLRVPYPGYLEVLDRAWEAGQFAGTPPMAAYRQVGGGIPASPWNELIAVKVDQPVGMEHGLGVLEAFRAAVLGRAGDAGPAVLHGHGAAASRPHVAWAGLGDVGHRHARGHLVGLGLWLPADCSDMERAYIALAVRAVERFRFQGRELGVALAQGQSRKALDGATWTRPARVWTTVAPMVLNRHPKKTCPLERIVAENCQLIGLPAPRSVEFGRSSYLAGVPDSPGFRVRQPGRLYGHVRLIFDHPVRGPLLLGVERYFGLGFCRPVPEGAVTR